MIPVGGVRRREGSVDLYTLAFSTVKQNRSRHDSADHDRDISAHAEAFPVVALISRLRTGNTSRATQSRQL
jgi:hypothetical protein